MACSSRSPTHLAVVQELPVDFGAMEAFTPEGGDAVFEDLRIHDDYGRLARRFRCASLDRHGSLFDVRLLDAQTPAAPLWLGVWVGHPEEDLVQLVDFFDVVEHGDVIDFWDLALSVFDEGLAVIEQAALSAEPTFDMYIEGEAEVPVDFLIVDLVLEIFLSDSRTACRHVTAGL